MEDDGLRDALGEREGETLVDTLALGETEGEADEPATV